MSQFPLALAFRASSQGMGTLLKLAALTLGDPLPGGSPATPGSPWGQGSGKAGSSLHLACMAMGRGLAQPSRVSLCGGCAR